MRKQRLLALLLASLLAATQLTACAAKTPSTETETEAATTEAGITEAPSDVTVETETGAAEEKDWRQYLGVGDVGAGWLVAAVEAYPDAEKPELKDDFYTAINYDSFKTLNLKDGEYSTGSITEMSDIMEDKALSLINDESVTGHDIDVCRALFHATTDWEARNQAGMTPFEETFKQIQDIKTIDDVTEIMKGDDAFLSVLFNVAVQEGSFDQKNTYILSVNPGPMIYSDMAEYQNPSQQAEMIKALNQQLAEYMFTRFGATAEDADACLEKCLEFETELASVLPSNEEASAPDFIEKAYNPYTYDELKELEKNFPVLESLDASDLPKANTYSVTSPAWLKKMNSLYTDDNLENIKAYLLLHFVNGITSFADREAYETTTDIQNQFYGMTGYESDDELGVKMIDQMLSLCMDNVYVDNYCTPELRQEIIDIIVEFKDYYRKMLETEDWLSEETRNKAIEKLDAMKINAVYSDKRNDYSGLDVKDGMSLTEVIDKISDFTMKQQFQKLNKPYNEELFQLESTRIVNAGYMPTDNSINIFSGILQGACEPGVSYEHDLATIGTIIGHEISHAFDANGSMYDKDGNYATWWTDEDYAAFENRTQELKDYVSRIVPFEGQQAVNGEIVKGEVCADITALKAALFIAESHEDFDYEEFFRSYPSFWGDLQLAEMLAMKNAYDEHPLYNIRVNVTAQQADKFYETFDIKEGDGMYLAPEDRINIW